MTDETRTPSPIDAIAEDYSARMLALSPGLRVSLGVEGDPHALDDYSPAGAAAVDELNAATLTALDREQAAHRDELDDVDAVTLDAMRERLGVERELHARGLDVGVLNNIASPAQDIRDLFDLVPTETAADWAASAGKLRSVAGALAGYEESLRVALAAGRAPAVRQVRAVMAQATEVARSGGSFDAFVSGETVPEALRGELADAAAQAKGAYAGFKTFLETAVLPHARTQDAAGREDYALYSREFLGASVDLDETYQWGLEQVAELDAEQRRVAQLLYPGEDLSVRATLERLDADPARKIHGLDALRTWMQETADQAIAQLDGTHFDIPEDLKQIEAMVLPNGTGGIYYTGPTDDFSRPGRMWWSVPAGVEEFSTWQELTTVYHEGVPGHHLQLGTAVQMKDRLNMWRRNLCWVSGHGEGWALYAEKFMAEQGFMEEPGNYMGTLDSQRLRAARVVVDLGVHLGKKAPAEYGGGIWDAEKAWKYLTDNVAMERNFLRYELDRYLGWPGQAPSYKIGQRLWESARDTARAKAQAAGREFSLKDFHTRALALGSVGLDTLTRALERD